MRCEAPEDVLFAANLSDVEPVRIKVLEPAEAARVVEDVIAFHAEPLEGYVRRRHAELKTYGLRNPEIFARLAEELAHRVVAAPELSERQLRRIIYG